MRNLALLFLALCLAGCGSNSSSSGQVLAPQTVTIGVIAPLDAGLVAFGRGIRNSVELAVRQANASRRFPGLNFVVDARDDSSTPAIGAAAAQSLLNVTNLAGVVGTYNSGVAAAVLPVLSPGNILMISPGNTNPSLTRGNDPNNPVRPFANYFRVVVPDSIQGPVLANYTVTTLHFSKVAIVTEDKAVSKALVDAYETTFTGQSGVVAVKVVVPDGTVNYTPVIDQVKAANVQMIVYGGEFATAAPFRQQATAQGLTVPLMGSDGIKDAAYLVGAGAAAEGDFASSVGAPPAQQPGGASFQSAYDAAGFQEGPSDFGPYAYDAANLIMAAVARQALNRGNLLKDIQNTATTGVTGPLGFDSFGDTTHKVVTVYHVENGVFVPAETITVP